MTSTPIPISTKPSSRSVFFPDFPARKVRAAPPIAVLRGKQESPAKAARHGSSSVTGRLLFIDSHKQAKFLQKTPFTACPQEKIASTGFRAPQPYAVSLPSFREHRRTDHGKNGPGNLRTARVLLPSTMRFRQRKKPSGCGASSLALRPDFSPRRPDGCLRQRLSRMRCASARSICSPALFRSASSLGSNRRPRMTAFVP